MAGKIKDLHGMKAGRLTVTKLLGRNPDKRSTCVEWECICDCGNLCVKRSSGLLNGQSTSCGCLTRQKLSEATANRNLKHGMSHTRVHDIWIGMINRCKKDNSHCKGTYQEIDVCEGWLDFETFYNDMGEPPDKMSLDRIDNSKGYSKDNCRWATQSQQAFNQSKRKNNSSGRTGVVSLPSGKWLSQIYVNKVHHNLGTFNSFEEACAAREAAELKYYGFTKE